MGIMTKEQVLESNLKDAKKVLNAAVKALQLGGQRAISPSAWSDDGVEFFLSIDTDAGKGSEVTFKELQEKAERLKLMEVGYNEGIFDWASDTYIKPRIWAKFSI